MHYLTIQYVISTRDIDPEELLLLEFQSYQSDQTIETSSQRNNVAQNILRALKDSENKDTTNILVQLFLGEEEEAIEQLERCRINPSFDPSVFYRNDIEFIIPQLLSYFVMQSDLGSEDLRLLLQKASMLDFHFGHLCLFYLQSLSTIVFKDSQHELMDLKEFIGQTFIPLMQQNYKNKRLFSVEIVNKVSFLTPKTLFDQEESRIAQRYATAEQLQFRRVLNFNLQKFNEHSFLETPFFFNRLISISNKITTEANKKAALIKEIKKLNQCLPACVYIPFFRDSIRNYCVLKIVPECRVFQTKERAPFMITLEVFRPEETFYTEQPEIMIKHQRSKFTNSVLMSPQQNAFINFDYKVSEAIKITEREMRARSKSLHSKRRKSTDKSIVGSFGQEVELQFEGVKEWNISLLYNKEQAEQKHTEGEINCLEEIEVEKKDDEEDEIFGESMEQTEARFRAKSVFGGLASWKLISLIVKTGDNLKQEQFAMQLIYQFCQIFDSEGVNLALRPYEVISMGPDCGIIEMIPDVITLDGLMKKLEDRQLTLSEFFKWHYGTAFKRAMRNFRKSLVAYSLVTYFLQIKDRHNGNILLTRDGSIIHIDFGFFLSNSPKGHLQRVVPFKLLSEHVEVMGGIESKSFKKFRIYFANGFKAVIKNKDKIMVLVKAMFAAHGSTMPCFVRGNMAVDQLQKRMSPAEKGIELTGLCNDLINSSLDNWRARWYDKYQYHFQGIFY